MSPLDPMYRAAREVLARGWIPVPLNPDSKRPSMKWKNREEWIDDPAVVRKVWGPSGSHEGHGVGIVTEPSGLNVLDLDLKHEGERALADLGHKIEGTLRRRTPSGGVHGYYRAQNGPIRTTAKLQGRLGIDTRGRGGMVVWAMPGKSYGTVEDLDPADTPAWLYEAAGGVSEHQDNTPDFRPKQFLSVVEGRRYVERALQRLRDAVEGERNERVRDAALCLGHFPDEFWTLDEARDLVMEAASCSGADVEPDTPRTLANALRDARAQGTHELATPDADEPSSWSLVDLAAVLAGDVAVPDPTVLRRTDGQGLLYPASIHWVFGEPESGKSWVALAACAEQLRAGHHALYLDYENGAVELVERMRVLGITGDELARLHIIEPDTRLAGSDAELYAEHLRALRPAVVVVDAATEVLDVEGLNPNDPDAISKFVRLYLKPAAKAGAAVVVIDHVVKDTDKRGLWPAGSQHKKSAVTGSAFLVRMAQQFAPGQIGRADLVVAKDRRGKVRAAAPDRRAGVFVLDASGSGCTWKVAPGSPGRPSALAERTQLLLEELQQADGPVPRNDLIGGGGRSRPLRLAALQELLDQGLAVEVPTTKKTESGATRRVAGIALAARAADEQEEL